MARKMVEIENVSNLTPMQREEREDRGPYIDVQALANQCGLRYFTYQEEYPSDARETRTAHFLHERGLETGLKFYKKRQMAEMVLAYSIHRLVDGATSLVDFGGRRGCRVATTMSERDLAEVRRARAEKVAA